MEGGRREERAGLVGAEMLFCERADGEDHLWRGEGGRREQGWLGLRCSSASERMARITCGGGKEGGESRAGWSCA